VKLEFSEAHRLRSGTASKGPHPVTLGDVALLALKLVLTPLLIGVASLGARRWGTTAGGWSCVAIAAYCLTYSRLADRG
jgi:hypothetical protein